MGIYENCLQDLQSRRIIDRRFLWRFSLEARTTDDFGRKNFLLHSFDGKKEIWRRSSVGKSLLKFFYRKKISRWSSLEKKTPESLGVPLIVFYERKVHLNGLLIIFYRTKTSWRTCMAKGPLAGFLWREELLQVFYGERERKELLQVFCWKSAFRWSPVNRRHP